MTADVTQDRRVTEAGLGSSDSAFVDGSRLFWASPSPVHERSGFGSFTMPDRIQVDAVLTAHSYTAQSRDHVTAKHGALYPAPHPQGHHSMI